MIHAHKYMKLCFRTSLKANYTSLDHTRQISKDMFSAWLSFRQMHVLRSFKDILRGTKGKPMVKHSTTLNLYPGPLKTGFVSVMFIFQLEDTVDGRYPAPVCR